MSDLGSVIGGGIVAIGASALGVQYLRRKWPYAPNDNNVYLITQYLTGHKGPVLKPNKPGFFPYPIVKFVKDKDGNPMQVPAYPLPFDFNKSINGSMKYVTLDELDGVLENCQFTYIIPNEKEAKKYYWKGQREIGRVEEFVRSAINQEIGAVRELEETGKSIEIGEGEVIKEVGGGNLIKNFGGIAKKSLFRLNSEEEYSLMNDYGIKVLAITLASPVWSEKSKGIISELTMSYQKARARIVTAQSQATEAMIQAESTGEQMKKYLEIAGGIKKEGSNLPKGDIALHLREGDNIESIAGKENIHAIYYSSSKNLQEPPPYYEAPSESSNEQKLLENSPKAPETDNSGKQNNLEEETLKSKAKTPKEELEDILGE